MALIPRTPPKALPGAYIQTPAFNKFQTGSMPQPAFRSVPAPLQQQQNGPKSGGQALSVQPQQRYTVGKSTAGDLKPIERAARSLNETLNQESRYPEIDSYVGRECFGASRRLLQGSLSLQRAFLPTMTFRHSLHGLRFRGPKFTPSLTKSSNNTTELKFRLRWGFSRT